jgi:hypothetical protein
MELSPLRVISCPPPPCERTQSLPDCFRQPRTVDSELPGLAVVLLGVVLLGVCGFWLLVLPLPALPLPDCAKAMPVASINVINNFLVMCCSFEVSNCPSGY